MHPIRLLLLAALASFATSARADVAVWKGQGTQVSNISTVNDKAKVTIYFVVDLTAFTGRIIVATPATKQVYDEGERTYGVNLYPSDGKDTFVLTDAIESAPQMGPIEFNHQMAHISGKNVPVFLGPQNTEPTQLPKTVKFLLSETAGGIFVTQGCVVQGLLLFQTSRTQAANAVNKTVLQVSQDIRSELISAKGFTEVMAPQ